MHKIIIIGDPRVGKTSARKKYMGHGFKDTYQMTLGSDFAVKRLGDSALQIWDLAGNKVYAAVRKQYYRGAYGALLIYDMTQPRTFHNLPTWIQEIELARTGEIKLALVANKYDLYDDKGDCISDAQGAEYAKKLSDELGSTVPYYHMSAKTGENVDQIFEDMIGANQE